VTEPENEQSPPKKPPAGIGVSPSNPAELHPPAEENGALDDTQVITADPPLWIQQASLSELLLWRLGIPLDREKMESEHKQAEAAIDLKPPITTAKVADIIAHLSMQLMRGEVDAATAKTSLYALQTLLTALRLQIVEEKKPKNPKNARTKARKPARRRKQIAKRKR
jgi:hypothetical protein